MNDVKTANMDFVKCISPDEVILERPATKAAMSSRQIKQLTEIISLRLFFGNAAAIVEGNSELGWDLEMSAISSNSGGDGGASRDSGHNQPPRRLFDGNASDSDGSSDDRVLLDTENTNRGGCLKPDRARDDQPGSSRGRAPQQVRSLTSFNV
ncbi:unnamed protein product [Haemonchus placei]|uniref:Uncharacterized protein n=1 Tax=Haemonchus placei TaxID=6290 RepID=A0A158QNN8_HAEPC|nr:unnamed protein product [Haemonchus placei]